MSQMQNALILYPRKLLPVNQFFDSQGHLTFDFRAAHCGLHCNAGAALKSYLVHAMSLVPAKTRNTHSGSLRIPKWDETETMPDKQIIFLITDPEKRTGRIFWSIPNNLQAKCMLTFFTVGNANFPKFRAITTTLILLFNP